MAKKTILNLSAAELAGRRVLVRVDFNVPLDGMTIIDDTRIRTALPTIKDLMEKGAKVILCSHMGRPKGKVVDSLRLTPVAARLSELLEQEVVVCRDCVGDSVTRKLSKLESGQVALLENLRFHPEEERNDPEFAKQLAFNADLYVNDAFASAHRAHASTEGVTHYLSPSVAGYLIEKELNYFQAALKKPQRPLAAIIGGSKVSDKIGVIETLLEKCDKLIIGGGMIFTFYKARGFSVGKSLVENDKLELAKSLEARAKEKGVDFLLPSDVVLADNFASNANNKTVSVDSIEDGWMGLDIGPNSIKLFQEALADCKTVIWNGPMGVFEFDKFSVGTEAIAQTLADLTETGTTTIIGGGDSVAAVEKVGVAERISHISTGGGASLDFLEGKTLPGITALDEA
ncbi:MAG: phosphoglycerate kinase [cyanobacterium endosymbiont of Rhopalodia musculus]|uniref:phosphoglycerate kinase n=1 Tax=cyanobacterium endosymbiont of Epithemia clementina EcSB TaxID=3034674 RepID=UPI0024804828|nr:phosphoglycerate kinase [cyanobacterium endosymbiont of Epithemia clementina EcSB]WGT68050.1 phosphoglycerate kinase [cyanobacterium endosymbiont of Epithemia clementina EcSB]